MTDLYCIDTINSVCSPTVILHPCAGAVGGGGAYLRRFMYIWIAACTNRVRIMCLGYKGNHIQYNIKIMAYYLIIIYINHARSKACVRVRHKTI